MASDRREKLRGHYAGAQCGGVGVGGEESHHIERPQELCLSRTFVGRREGGKRKERH